MLTDKVENKYSKRSSRWKLILLMLIFALVVVIIFCLNIGFAPISFSDILAILGKQIPFLNGRINLSTVSSVNQVIILQIRLPRVLAGAVVGAGLAASGVMYQGVFRNPMADSFLLGASAGAYLGYTLAIIYSSFLFLWLGLGLYQIVAFIGAAFAVSIVYSLARVGNKVQVTTLLLAGLVMNIFFLAIQNLFALRYSTLPGLAGIVTWLAGGFTNITWIDIIAVFPVVLFGIVIGYFFTKDLNMLAMGDDTAQHLGVNTERVRQALLLLGSLITAAVVCISGIIGFVGLIIPHLTRLVIGPDHRILLPTSVIVGAIFLILCDALARVATGVSELPVGVITAIIGTPVFIYLLRRRKTSYSL